jgi:hypothetical protein
MLGFAKFELSVPRQTIGTLQSKNYLDDTFKQVRIRIRTFLGLPDPLFRVTDPDPSIMLQKY